MKKTTNVPAAAMFTMVPLAIAGVGVLLFAGDIAAAFDAEPETVADLLLLLVGIALVATVVVALRREEQPWRCSHTTEQAVPVWNLDRTEALAYLCGSCDATIYPDMPEFEIVQQARIAEIERLAVQHRAAWLEARTMSVVRRDPDHPEAIVIGLPNPARARRARRFTKQGPRHPGAHGPACGCDR